MMYEIIFDTNGKPSSEYAKDVTELKSVLVKGYQLSQEDEFFDLKVFCGETELTESQLVTELVSEIMGE